MHFIGRIKDLHFDTGPIVVRNGKGQKDRVTVLPKSVSESLSGVVEETKKLHKQDSEAFTCHLLFRESIQMQIAKPLGNMYFHRDNAEEIRTVEISSSSYS